MLNRLGSDASGAPGPAEENPVPDAFNSIVDFNRPSDKEIERVIALYRLIGDDIERMIALCEAPGTLLPPTLHRHMSWSHSG